MSSETYPTAREAAEYVRSAESTLAKLRLSGGGPKFCRIGRAIRYRKVDPDGWMTRTRVQSTSDDGESARRDLAQSLSRKGGRNV
jgi:hypothetical protein